MPLRSTSGFEYARRGKPAVALTAKKATSNFEYARRTFLARVIAGANITVYTGSFTVTASNVASFLKQVNNIALSVSAFSLASFTKQVRNVALSVAESSVVSFNKQVNNVYLSIAEASTVAFTPAVQRIASFFVAASSAATYNLMAMNVQLFVSESSIVNFFKQIWNAILSVGEAATVTFTAAITRAASYDVGATESVSFGGRVLNQGTGLVDHFRADYWGHTEDYTPEFVTDVLRENESTTPDDSWITRLRQFYRGRF